MATIRQRPNGSWQVQVRRRGWPTQTGSFPTRTAARKWANEIEHAIDVGKFAVSTRSEQQLTLDQALVRYSELVTPKKKGAEVEQRRIQRLRNDASDLGQMYLGNIRGADIAEYRDRRLSTPSRTGGKKSRLTGRNISPATVRLELALLSHVFTTAAREWRMESLDNPVSKVALPSKSRRRERRLEPGEYERLIQACAAYQDLPDVVDLAIHTAMRRSEIASLKWRQVFLGQRRIHLPDTKNNTARDIPLDDRAMEVLSQRHAQRVDENVIHIAANGITTYFSRCVARAGMEDFRFHDLRHEAASRMAEKGLSPIEISTITGHKSMDMLRRYSHPRVSDLATRLSEAG